MAKWKRDSNRTHNGYWESKRYSVPPIKWRPSKSLHAASTVQTKSINREAIAWLEIRRRLLVQIPAQVRITAQSQSCRKFAGPQVCQYAGIQTRSQKTADHRCQSRKYWGIVEADMPRVNRPIASCYQTAGANPTLGLASVQAGTEA